MGRSVLLHHELADRIRALIRSRGLTPGTPLPSERELASLFSVSRPSVRTGLLVLHLTGDIEIKCGSASFVRGPRILLNPGFDGAGPLEILRARLTIESSIASEAARRAGTIDIARLRLLVDKMRATTCPVAHRSLSRSFHRSLALMSRQRAVADILALLMNAMPDKLLDFASDEELRDCLEAETFEHGAILKAIIARDATRALKSMRDHLFRVKERLREGKHTHSSLDENHQPTSPNVFHHPAYSQDTRLHRSSAFPAGRNLG